MPKPTNSKGSHKTLTEKAYAIIKTLIVRGEIKEGTFLPETDFIRKYGFGRTPFREACNRLHHEQLLEVVPHRGYLIPEISLRAAREILEARYIFECMMVEVACARATDAQIRGLERLAEPRRLRNEDSEAMIELNKEFHLAIARMTHNEQLERLLKGILQQTERLSYIEVRGSGFRPSDLRMAHGPVVEAIRRRDPAAARKAIGDDIKTGQAKIFWPEGHTNELEHAFSVKPL